MAQVLSGGNAAIQALLYGNVHPATQRYFESQSDTLFSRLKQGAKEFAREAVERFGFMASERTQRMIRDVRRAANWAYRGDYVRYLSTIDDIQMASPTMRRYVMAEPTIRERFQKQQISGYDEQYTDFFPDRVGENHPDYQRVMQDVVVVGKLDGEDDVAYATHWMEDTLEDETPLSFDEQLDIQQTWAMALDAIVKGKQDPTSLYGASLE